MMMQKLMMMTQTMRMKSWKGWEKKDGRKSCFDYFDCWNSSLVVNEFVAVVVAVANVD